MKKGDRFQIKIESLASSGDGVARVDNFVVFIADSCPEDELEVVVTKVKKTFAIGKVVKILKPSPNRLDPPCEIFENCGGCSWQHVSYSEQLHWKRKNLLKTLKNIGKFEDIQKVLPTVASPNKFHYRNRIQVQSKKEGLFYFGKKSHDRIPVNQCLIADEKINHFMKQAPLSEMGKIEIATTTEGVKTFPVDKFGNSKLGFRQVNDEQNRTLQEMVSQVIKDRRPRGVYDLYCGQGNWTLALANNHPDIQFIAIDKQEINIQKAVKDALPNTHFICADVLEVFPVETQGADLVIIDPPRSGCDPKLLEKISNSSVQSLIYISCHPATFARDLQYLLQQNWLVDQIVPVDMFPHTPHLETWSLLHSDKG